MLKFRIRELREDNDLTQKEVAKVVNLSQQQYSRIENEEAAVNADVLLLLSKFYKVSIDYILSNKVVQDEKYNK